MDDTKTMISILKKTKIKIVEFKLIENHKKEIMLIIDLDYDSIKPYISND